MSWLLESLKAGSDGSPSCALAAEADREGGVTGQMSGASGISPGDTPAGFATRHIPWGEGGMCLSWFPIVSVSVFLCVCIVILALLLNSNKERGTLVFAAASPVHARISCLLG